MAAKLTDEELAEIAEVAQISDVGKRIRAAGYPCKHVYRFWPPGESDAELEGSPCELALYLDSQDAPWTARLRGEAVVVDPGW